MKVRVTKKLSDAPISIPITTEFIKLQDFLKFANAVESGGMAKNFIVNGEVQVNGEVCTQRGRKLRPVDKYPIASSRFVLPCALSPTSRFTPGTNSASRCS